MKVLRVPVISISFTTIVYVLFFSCRTSEQQKSNSLSIQTEESADNHESSLLAPGKIDMLEGRFLGYLNFESNNISLPISLDLISRRRSFDLENKNQSSVNLEGIFKINTGNFVSSEYISSYFKKISLSENDGNVTFAEGSNPKVNITSASVNEENVIYGNLINEEGISGQFTLTKMQDEVYNSGYARSQARFPIKSSISGYYAGFCQQGQHNLTIQVTAPVFSESERQTATLAFYAISKSQKMVRCAQDVCDQEPTEIGQFDLLTQTLIFNNANETSRQCLIKGDNILCDGCVYVKQENYVPAAVVSLPIKKPRQNFFEHKQDEIIRESKIISGEYFGLLFHEQLNRWIIGRLMVDPNLHPTVASAKSITEPHSIKGVLNVFVGNPRSNKFFIESINGDINQDRPGLVLEGTNNTLLKIISWQPHIVKALWYSKSFGYIGQAVFSRGAIPTPKIKKRRIIEGIHGTFGFAKPGQFSKINIQLNPPGYNIPQQEYLGFIGEFEMSEDNQKKRLDFTQGIYNLFLGTFHARLSNNHWVSGSLKSRGVLLTNSLNSGQPSSQSNHPPKSALLKRLTKSQKKLSER